MKNAHCSRFGHLHGLFMVSSGCQYDLLFRFLRLCIGRIDLRNERDKTVLVFAAATILVAFASWITVLINVPAISFDTTVYDLEEGNGEILHVIKSGRFMQAILLYLFPRLAIAHSITGIFFLVLISVSTVALLLFFSGNSQKLGAREYIAAFFCVTFPYWESQFYFPFLHVAFAIGILLPTVSVIILFIYHGFWNIFAAIILVCLSLGFYQASMHVFLCLLLASAAVRVAYGDGIRHTFFVLLKGAGASLGAAFGYLLLHKAAMHLSGLSSLSLKGGYSVSPDFCWHRFLDNMPLLFHGNSILLPPWQNSLIYFMAFISCIMIARKVSIKSLLFFLCCIILSLYSNIVLSFVTSQGLTIRTCVSISFWFACIIHLSNTFCITKMRYIMNAVFIICIFFFCINSNFAWRILNEMSQWDMIQAMQMKHDIQRYAYAKGVNTPYNVSIIGCIGSEDLPWPVDWHSLTGYSMLSCFGKNTVGQHPYGLFQRIGTKDFDFKPVRDSDFARIGNRRPWPSEESIFMDEEGLAIWLGPAGAKQPGLDEGFIALARRIGVRDPMWLTGKEVSLRPSVRWFLDEVEKNPAGPWGKKTSMTRTLFAVDAMTVLDTGSGFVRVAGWAYDLQNCTRPDLIFFLNDQDLIVGIAHTGILRRDLGKTVASRASYSGFVGYVLKDSHISQAVYISG